MKAIFTLLLAILLASCAVHPTPAGTVNPDPGVTLRTQHAVYDDSCDYVLVYVENNTDETVKLGDAWYLEKKLGDAWYRIDIGPLYFNSIGYSVMPGGSSPHICNLGAYRKHLDDGEYRIVKDLRFDGDDPETKTWYAAEFTIGDSSVTAETPHGFSDIIRMRDGYPIETARAEGAVIITAEGIENEEALTEFFRYAGSYRWRGQLRIADYTDGTVTDVIRAEDSRYDYLYRKPSGDVTGKYFTYCNTDGRSVWLSNHKEAADFSENEPIIESEAAAEYVSAYRMPDTKWSFAAWSLSGDIHAAINPGRGISINTENWGTGYGGKDRSLIENPPELLGWIAHDMFVTFSKTADGWYLEKIFVDAGDMDSITTVASVTQDSMEIPEEWWGKAVKIRS